jgi:TRAP-type C4-dicarboxylate transport system permease small subunit
MNNRIIHLLNNFEEYLAAFALSVTLAVTVLNVIGRYFFNYSFGWAGEISTMGFTWGVFIGTSACYKRKMHLGMDMLIHALPQKGQRIVGICLDAFFIIGFAYLAYLIIIFSYHAWTKPTDILGIPYTFVDIAPAIGFFMMAVHSVRFFLKRLRNPDLEEAGLALVRDKIGDDV